MMYTTTNPRGSGDTVEEGCGGCESQIGRRIAVKRHPLGTTVITNRNTEKLLLRALGLPKTSPINGQSWGGEGPAGLCPLPWTYWAVNRVWKGRSHLEPTRL